MSSHFGVLCLGLCLTACGNTAARSVDAAQESDGAAPSADVSGAFGDLVSLSFNKVEGNYIHDHSGLGHHGQFTTNNPGLGTGVYGTAWLKTGLSSLRIGDAANLFFGNAFTLEAWLLHAGQFPYSIYYNLRGENREVPLEVNIRIMSASQIRLETNDGCTNMATTQVTVDLSEPFSIGAWEHLAISWEGEMVRVYRNANEVGSQAFSSSPCDVPDGAMALQPPEGGAIDEFKLWSGARSAQQIAASMNYDSSALVQLCGDGVTEGSEECDAANACCDAARCLFSTKSTPCGSAGLCESGVCVDDQGAVSTGLLADYDFEEGTGTSVLDAIAPSLDLTIPDPSAVIWGDGYLEIRRDTTLESALSGSKVVTAVKASKAFSIEAWVLPSSLVALGPARIVTMGDSQNEQNFMLGQHREQFAARVRTRLLSLPDSLAQALSLPLSLRHVVFTIDQDQRRYLYIDGVLSLQHAATNDVSTWDETWKLRMGNEAGQARYWRGQLHRIRMYDKALTHAEVGRNYTEGP